MSDDRGLEVLSVFCTDLHKFGRLNGVVVWFDLLGGVVLCNTGGDTVDPPCPLKMKLCD